MNNSISFKGSYKGSVKVPKLQPDGTFSDKKVSVVKLDPDSKDDVQAVDNLKFMWHTNNISDITENMEVNTQNFSPWRSYYILTTQNDNLNKLNSDKIVGVAQVSEKRGDVVNVNYMEINDTKNKELKQPNYKCVAPAMIEAIQNLYPGKTLE